MSYNEFKIAKSELIEEYRKNPFKLPREIAVEFGVDERTVVRWIAEGRFGETPAHIKSPGDRHLVRMSAVSKAKKKLNEGLIELRTVPNVR